MAVLSSPGSPYNRDRNLRGAIDVSVSKSERFRSRIECRPLRIHGVLYALGRVCSSADIFSRELLSLSAIVYE